MMALGAFWSLILVFESAVPTIPEKIFWSRLEYFCNMGIPLMFLRFILSYDLGGASWIKRHFGLFLIVPLFTLLLVFSSSYHSLIWTGFSWSPMGENVLIYHHGPVFYFAMIYSLLITVLGNILLISFVRKRRRYFKSKTWFLIVGSLFPLLTGLIYTIGFAPLEGLDISPMGILVSGILFFWGIASEQMFDIVPVGHRLMIEKMTDGAIVLDLRHFIMDINPVAMDMFMIRENIIGQGFDLALPSLSRSLEGKPEDSEYRQELWMDPPVSRWFEIMHNPMKSDKEKYLGSLLILHDITIRKENEFQLEKLADELTEMNAMKDKLYSIIGHDLRSPFNSILGFSELLAESYDEFSDKERKQFAVNISIASKSALGLLENLLEWSRIQLGRTPFIPEELNLNLLVNEAILLLRLNAQSKGIMLLNRVAPDQKVFADKNMVGAILRNLLSNGIKFTNSGGQVEVTAEKKDRQVEIMVTDNGTGMPEEMVRKLFNMDSLVSVPGTSNEKGTGLGLILCKEFVEKHGGAISVTSLPGTGSSFAFTLPGK